MISGLTDVMGGSTSAVLGTQTELKRGKEKSEESRDPPVSALLFSET